MATFRYVPGEKTVIKHKLLIPGLFTFVIKNNGTPITLPKFRYEDDKILLVCEKGSAETLYFGSKVQIFLPLVTEVTINFCTSADNVKLLKESLPVAIKALANSYKPIPKYDLMTGDPIVNKISIEYGFQEGGETERIEEKIGPAKILFDCRSPDQGRVVQGVCRAGRIMFPSVGSHCASVWSLDRLGWHTVPPAIKWSPEEIEQAFRDLAKNLLAEPEIPDCQIWKAKQVTQITLE